MQEPNRLLTILSRMAQKPEVKFDKLFQKLFNPNLWLMAYESIAPKPGNLTKGTDDRTVDGMGMERIEQVINDLKMSRYKPTPSRRTYIEKANGKLRPLGIASFEDKLLQTVVKFILEAIYEPLFSELSHGFRPNRSCHTALEQVKKMTGTKWWIEGDIASFFDNLDHDVLIHILSQRITDKRFLHLIQQFLEAGYLEEGEYHETYSGAPQGGNLSPILSNIYLNELDSRMERRIAEFNQGKQRRHTPEYNEVVNRRRQAKKKACKDGDWCSYKELTEQMLDTTASDPQDPDFRRMTYCRYADDFLVGIIGSKADAIKVKEWLTDYLRTELRLELSPEKTLITNARKRVRFLGYDLLRWPGERRLKYRHGKTATIRRVGNQQLALLIPYDKTQAFGATYGNVQKWRGYSRGNLTYMSELEILMTYNAEIRGFLGYYALADNLTDVASNVLWLTTGSFMRTLADKYRSSVRQEASRLKRGPNQYIVTHLKADGTTQEYALVSSTQQLGRKKVSLSGHLDHPPTTWQYRNKTELGQRLRANECEWCGTRQGAFEVHHVRKLKNLEGKSIWERHMIARRRKTMVLCKQCHVDLHAGRLSEATKRQGKTGEPDTLNGVRLVRRGVQ
ncbi:MAG: reverse transcriptase domain-containing protein [Caldilineaceae bacterium]